jgi:serine/threonine-protein kinase
MTEKLGKYRLLQLLATGGMGEVFLARQDGPAGFSKTVVIKRILRHLATDQSFVDMFVNEARLAGLLQHPNIVQIFELGHEGDDWFIAMEYVHGRSLHACVEQAERSNLRADPRIAARVCAQALQGLHFAHQLKDEKGNPLGILHRDVTPDNVLVSFAGGVKLVDFGIAKAMNASQVTRAGTLKGKFGYMAPEQFNADATLDARTDLYAMGVTLHELLFNARPNCVPGSSEEARKPRVGFSRRHELHASLNDILERALYPNAKDRFASAGEMANALEGFIAATGDPLTSAHVAEWLERTFGKDAADQNVAVASRAIPQGTNVMSGPFMLPPGIVGTVPGTDMVASAPTMIDRRLQGGQRDTDPPAAVVLPEPPPEPRPRWPLVLLGLVLLLVGAGVAWNLRAPTVAPLVVMTPVVQPVKATKAAKLTHPPEERPVPPPIADVAPPAEAVDAGPAVVVAPEPPKERLAQRKHVVPRPGRVTVRVNPWAEVLYQGRSYGVTPVAPITVPAGTATFTLRNKQLGVTKQVSIKVPAGGEVVLKADLFKAKNSAN